MCYLCILSITISFFQRHLGDTQEDCATKEEKKERQRVRSASGQPRELLQGKGPENALLEGLCKMLERRRRHVVSVAVALAAGPRGNGVKKREVEQ